MVYTQALSDENKILMENIIKENCTFKFNFIPVLAKKEIICGIEFDLFDFDKLIEIYILRAKETVKTILIESFIFQERQLIENNLKVINIQDNSFHHFQNILHLLHIFHHLNISLQILIYHYNYIFFLYHSIFFHLNILLQY